MSNFEKIEHTDFSVPKGWFVQECGQDPLHMLWYMVLVSFDDVSNNLKSPRYVLVEECDGFIEALEEAKNKINNKNFGN